MAASDVNTCALASERRPCVRGIRIQVPRSGGMEAIFQAAGEGNEGGVIELLDAEPTMLEGVNGLGSRPLAVAAEHGQLGVVRLLIQRGADIHATGLWDWTALHVAAHGGFEEVVACLIHHGAQANSRDVDGTTPLMLAALKGHVGVVKMLLQHMGGQGLDDRSVDDGWTALHRAAFCGHDEVVRCLLLAGADPAITDDDRRTPRAIAELHTEYERLWDRRARCVAVFEWWEGELERHAALCRATCLHKAFTTQRDQPTSQVPTYLEARVAAGHAVPFVEVVSPQSQSQEQQPEEEAGGLRKKKAAGERGDTQGAEAGEEETRHAVVEYVVKDLNEELVTELLEGFHCGQ